MFSTFDLNRFGERVRDIRKSLGLSQRDVCRLCGINKDTLRKLENGITIPRYDTLEILSQVYKNNILLILNQYKKSNKIFDFYDKVDYLLRKNDIEEVKIIYNEYQSANSWNSDVINPNDIKQLDLFFQALILSFFEEQKSLDLAIKILHEALNLTNQNFNMNNIKSNYCSFFELRILLLLASILGIQRKCQESNKILMFISNSLDKSKYSRTVEKELVIKSNSIIAYNFHRLDEPKQALEYSQIGIDLCLNYEILANLPFLLFRKGISMIILNIDNYNYFLKQALVLLLIKEEYAIFEEYSCILKSKYSIEFKLLEEHLDYL